MNVFVYKDKKLALSGASERLNSLLEKYSSQPILLLLSGGSCHELVEEIDTKYISKNTTISVLDERYSKDPKENNFAQIASTNFYKKIKNICKFIDTRVKSGETLQELAQRFEDGLRGWRTTHPQGKIIATMGIGRDGHTAGIMCYPDDPELFTKLFVDTDKWVVGYDAKHRNVYPLRVTTTIPFLVSIVDYSTVFVVGEEKKDAMKKLFNNKLTISTVPSKVIYQLKDVQLFTDIAGSAT